MNTSYLRISIPKTRIIYIGSRISDSLPLPLNTPISPNKEYISQTFTEINQTTLPPPPKLKRYSHSDINE